MRGIDSSIVTFLKMELLLRQAISHLLTILEEVLSFAYTSIPIEAEPTPIVDALMREDTTGG
jgi:hypothetical protein